MTAGEAASAAVVPRHRGQLGWPAWLAGAAVFACLTLGTVAILAKNVANAFYVEGDRRVAGYVSGYVGVLSRYDLCSWI